MKAITSAEGFRNQGAEGDEVTGGWRKLHSEELHKLLVLTQYYPGDQMETGAAGGVIWNGWGGERRRT
jgi:hypothetical protein